MSTKYTNAQKEIMMKALMGGWLDFIKYEHNYLRASFGISSFCSDANTSTLDRDFSEWIGAHNIPAHVGENTEEGKMADALLTRRIQDKIDSEDLVASTWYFVATGISGPEDDFLGGEYIFKVMAGTGPGVPPTFTFFTPNGLFDTNGIRPCISIGHNYRDAYAARLGLDGFALELVNAMTHTRAELNDGIGFVKSSLEDRKKMAAESAAFNRKHFPHILQLVNGRYAEYSVHHAENARVRALELKRIDEEEKKRAAQRKSFFPAGSLFASGDDSSDDD